MLIGYARVSTGDQRLTLQIDALKEAGCDRIFEDLLSGASNNRPGLEQALEFARDGDMIVVWRLDRLSRSLRDLIDTVAMLKGRGVQLKSLKESIDTSSSSGQLIFHLFGALAEFERNLIKERTQAGLEAARARGRRGGRSPALDKNERALAVQLYDEKNHSIVQICKMMNISKPTLYKYVRLGRLEK